MGLTLISSSRSTPTNTLTTVVDSRRQLQNMATPDAPPAMPAAAATDVYCPHSPCSTIHKLGTPSFDDAKARMLREGYLTQDDLKDMELLDSLGIKTDNGRLASPFLHSQRLHLWT